MENLLNNIENSENNNPLLTAALQEIERLNKVIEEARDIVNCEMTSIRDGDGQAYTPTFDQVNDFKVDLLSNLLFS